MEKIAEAYHGNEIFLFEEEDGYASIVLEMLACDDIHRVRFLFSSDEKARKFALALREAIDVIVLS